MWTKQSSVITAFAESFACRCGFFHCYIWTSLFLGNINFLLFFHHPLIVVDLSGHLYMEPERNMTLLIWASIEGEFCIPCRTMTLLQDSLCMQQFMILISMSEMVCTGDSGRNHNQKVGEMGAVYLSPKKRQRRWFYIRIKDTHQWHSQITEDYGGIYTHSILLKADFSPQKS